MELSTFLAKLLGLYLLVVSALWALRPRAFAGVLEEFFAQRAVVFFSGLLALAVGLAMAISHSVWELSWRGAITLIGYLSIVKGVARIAFPDKLPKVASRAIGGPGKWIWIAITLALGAWLAWAGFTGGSPPRGQSQGRIASEPVARLVADGTVELSSEPIPTGGVSR